ncbi:caspase family protein [Mesorhizobium sp. M00.F.Ca.ET.216.01.1.1]|uniref:caspase family protein n=1 Tax=Mesorhizobium sp. M00.F.Ca.ET.216.01.1.1 TaxID=2500528 RepID=UPI000FD96635|nr:caspase family protein [Mesorhizobium sp. M00.F.Ca.ET.216.01.1.1]TGQ32384.1 caspase family protein [Mesorhizobium sp. M00.F.Ca.ET.216.01.1.1]
MNRRDVIANGTAAISLGFMPHVLAQPTPPVRAAVVIGVDNVDGLAKLSASKDADKVAAWLESEGFAVTKLTDANGAQVSSDNVFRAVRAIVDKATYELLVVYFAGHGFASGYSEWWMLSGAPTDTAQAITFEGSEILAKQCGITNVVIISDACRSLPTSVQLSRMQPRSMFPNPLGGTGITTQVDTFKAATFGMAASEAPLIDHIATKGGIFTATFMDAFRSPWPDMTATMPDGAVVVKNSKLKKYLESETNRRIKALQGITKSQIPEISAWSDVYLSRVLQSTRSTPDSAALTSVSPQSVAKYQLNKIGIELGDTSIFTTSAENRIKGSESFARFETLKQQISEAKSPASFETRAGLSVTGIDVHDVIVNNAVTTEVLPLGASVQNIRVAFSNGHRVADCMVHFADDQVAVLPVIQDFITNILYGENGIDSVTFVPSANGPRWSEYEPNQERIDLLHASVASASAMGAFRIEGDPKTQAERAARLGDEIRLMKSYDPTLGIYAAYAYAQAGLQDKVASVANFMSGDLDFEFFDLAMLSRRRRPMFDVFPSLPMLTQGWDYLAPLEVQIAPRLSELRPFLQRSLWTTLSGEARDTLAAFVRDKPPR